MSNKIFFNYDPVSNARAEVFENELFVFTELLPRARGDIYFLTCKNG